MKATLTLRQGMTWEKTFDMLVELANEDEKIQKDPHTNKHYELRNGKIWMKGNGTGRYWEYLCNSREAQRDAHEILGCKYETRKIQPWHQSHMRIKCPKNINTNTII